MAATLAATIQAGVTWNYATALAGGLGSSNKGGFDAQVTLTNGTGASGTADLMYAAQITLAGGASTTLDMNASALDFFGTTIAMVRVKAIFVALTTLTPATSISVGNAGSPLAYWISSGSATVLVRNGGFFCTASVDATGFPVTAGSADQLKFLNNDGAAIATANVCIIGSSA